jgi:CMP-N-acetylneuraminic acid synthetase
MMRSVAGHPLLAFMAGAALNSRLDRVILSTEDAEIAEVGKSVGLDVPFTRPAELASDFVPNDRVLCHALDTLAERGERFDFVVLLQPTAPFTTPADVDNCLDVLSRTGANCCFTATTVTQQPHWMFTATVEGELDLLIPGQLSGDRQHTQKLPSYVRPSGAVWAVPVKSLQATGRIYNTPMRAVMVEHERAVDIDNEFDFVMAEAVAKHYGFAPLAAAAINR